MEDQEIFVWTNRNLPNKELLRHLKRKFQDTKWCRLVTLSNGVIIYPGNGIPPEFFATGTYCWKGEQGGEQVQVVLFSEKHYYDLINSGEDIEEYFKR